MARINLAPAMLTAATLLVCAPQALAASSSIIPDARLSITLNNCVNGLCTGAASTTPGEFKPFSYINGGGFTRLGDVPVLETSINIAKEGVFNRGSVAADLYYYFRVTGPKDDSLDGLIVPIRFMAYGETAGHLFESGNGGAGSASLTIDPGVDPLTIGATALYAINSYGTVGGLSASFSADRTLNFSVGQIYQIYMGSTSTVAFGRPVRDGVIEGASFGYSYVDPMFQLLAATPGLSLEFSEGLGPQAQAAAPEPAEWALLLLGFAGVGAALRGRSRDVLGVGA